MSSLITTPLELLLPYQARWVADESRFKAGIWQGFFYGGGGGKGCDAAGQDHLDDRGPVRAPGHGIAGQV